MPGPPPPSPPTRTAQRVSPTSPPLGVRAPHAGASARGPAAASPQPPQSPFRLAKGKAVRAAERSVSLPSTAWTQAYAVNHPAAEEVGLRHVSEQDLLVGMGWAEKKAWQLHPEGPDEETRVETYNRLLVAYVVARGTCRAADIAKPFFPMLEDEVLAALTSNAIAYLFHAHDAFTVETSPTTPEAGDDDLAALAAALADGTVWNGMPLGEARRLRRLLGHVIGRLAATGG